MRTLLLSLAIGSCALAACHRGPAGGAGSGAELPVTKVILYQNGVGYFERRGKVKGDLVELRVRPDQINDVLKSLSVLDLAGGVPSSVSLPVEKSGDRLAAELPAQVRNASGMLGMLAVLRGAEVTVSGKNGTQRGRVVGVELPPRPPGKDGDHDAQGGAILTLMSGEDELVTVPVETIQKLTIGDRALSVGLQQSLDISKREGGWKPVSLSVRMAGDNTHDLIVSYIHEVPIWRPAYRAWVEKDKGVQLQGWAVVDNTSGEDWTGVHLSLVVGAPLSFRYNLHTPHNVTRPDLSPRLPSSADAPPEPDVGVEAAMPAAAPAPAPAKPAESALGDLFDDDAKAEADVGGLGLSGSGPGGGGGAMREMKKAKAPADAPAAARAAVAKTAITGALNARKQVAFASEDAAEEDKRREAAVRSAQALVTGKEVGALYAYESTTPVTVPDRSAALINIVSKKVDGKDVFLFREPSSQQPPFRAVLLRNDQGGTIEGGPITLYVDGTFAGEGFIGRIQRGETAFIPYARESGFQLGLKTDETEAEVHIATAVDGQIRLEGKRVVTRTLTLESTRDKPSLAYVKLATSPGMTLVDPAKDLVKAGADVYVPVLVAAKAKGEVKLVEASPVQFTETTLTTRVLDAFAFYLKNAKAEDALSGPIKELLAASKDLAALAAASASLETQRDILAQEQSRIQSNLDSLPVGTVAAALRQQLVGQLTNASKKAADVAKKLVENEVAKAALNEKVVVLLRQVHVK